jgi:23S rRNA (uracil1939-C5)-methyltransferase
MSEELTIDKLVHGGQGMGVLKDGRKAFIWNTLPGEVVRARLTRTKKDFVEGIAEEIISPSAHRIEPKEDIYLATSPWQIMSLEYENIQKALIVSETFSREHVELPDFSMLSDNVPFGYRNKIEFSFYGDDSGLHYAFFNRGSHQKQIVTESALALPQINSAAKEFLQELNTHTIRAGDLKSVIFRCDQNGDVVAALFVKPETFVELKKPKAIKGLKVYHSNPKSPASVLTKLIYQEGTTTLTDELNGTPITYDVCGFFQVNLPVFEMALKEIADATKNETKKVDMYSGVGTIGLAIGNTKTLVELDKANIDMANHNAKNQDVDVVHASTEKALQYIESDVALIVDPPRSGLHKDVIERILSVKPPLICYLSCNPATQARDVALLKDSYKIASFTGYNFFPKTPHIETLVILERQ